MVFPSEEAAIEPAECGSLPDHQRVHDVSGHPTQLTQSQRHAEACAASNFMSKTHRRRNRIDLSRQTVFDAVSWQ